MSSSFTFKVPQMLDFECVLDEYEDKKKIEAYFDYDHENPEISDEFVGEDTDIFYSPRAFTKSENGSEPRSGMRKSLSMSSLSIDNKYKISNLCSDMGQVSMLANDKKHHKNGDKLGSTSSLHCRSLSKDGLFQNSKVYMSMAEEVNNFHKRTPDRFHSKPKGWRVQLKPAAHKDNRTIPQSPAFSHIRKRPVTAISYEEKQRMEFEEAQKNQVKARPVNKKILEGPQRVKLIPKKGPTKVEPFKLSEHVKPKVVVVQEEKKEEFHAKPVPKSMYDPKPLPKRLVQATQPLTPNFVRKYTEKMKEAQANMDKEKAADRGKENKPDNKTGTRIAPFSFDQRIKTHLKKREELVKKVIEEEKKKTEFHAKPMPKMYVSRTKGSLDSVRSTTSSKSDSQQQLTVEFKARPAKVLNKEPFVPKKPDRPNIEFDEFNLATTRRARDRSEFEKKMKEKEEYQEQLRRELEEKRRMKEEEEIARLRKQKEYVAKPIRHYKEVPKIDPKPPTEPCSPNLATANLRRGNSSRDSSL